MSSSLHQADSWHQCRKCGEVYLIQSDSSVCPACGNPRVVSVVTPQSQTIITNVTGKKNILRVKPEFQPNQNGDEVFPLSEEPELADQNVVLPQKINHKKPISRERRDVRKLLIFVGIWLVLLAILCVVLLATKDDLQHNSRIKEEKQADIDLYKRGIASDVFNQTKDLVPQLAQEFFTNGSPHLLAQVCRKRPRIIQTLAAEAMKITSYSADDIPVLVTSNVAWCGEKPFLETLWKDGRDRVIELVFAQDDGEWRIDWESYARTSTLPWALFSTENGDAVGTFRFLVRERTVDNQNREQINVAFHEPSLFHNRDPISQTVPFMIDKKSRNGQLILAALRARNEGPPLLDSIYAEEDMSNTARVHVRIRRSSENGEKVFILEEVLACHWLGWDDPGIALPDAP